MSALFRLIRYAKSLNVKHDWQNLAESLNSGDGSAEDESVNVVRAFVGVDSLEVHDMPNDVVLVGDPVPAQHVAARPGNVQRLSAVVSL